MDLTSEHRRSVAFIESGSRTWACFLVTFPDGPGSWRGYFSFRAADGEGEGDEVRTTDIFFEPSEAEVHEKARSLGRPLLLGLLDSALHAGGHAQEDVRLRARFRTLLSENASELAGDWTEPGLSDAPDGRRRLESLYASYRLDQVAHLISLVEPTDFDAAVDRILEGEKIDFRSRDRVQFAMMVVEHLERLLPLPDFETWVRDFIDHTDAYRLYAHTLHREGRLP